MSIFNTIIQNYGFTFLAVMTIAVMSIMELSLKQKLVVNSSNSVDPK